MRPTVILALAVACASTPPPSKPSAPPAPAPPDVLGGLVGRPEGHLMGVEAGSGKLVILDKNGKPVDLGVEAPGTSGPPAEVGCSDGQREAFTDVDAFPLIAGCRARWEHARDLAAKGTGAMCGDDLGTCAQPADACAAGWHVCGGPGAASDLLQITGEQCEQAGPGIYVSALSHCRWKGSCSYDPPQRAEYGCQRKGWGSEPVCCGSRCRAFGICRDGVWPELTHLAPGPEYGCAQALPRPEGGVLCCRDRAPAGAGAAAADPATVVRAHAAEIDACLAVAHARRQKLEATITVDATGQVTEAALDPAPSSRRLGSCLLATIHRWSFPPPEAGTSVLFKHQLY